MAVSVNISESEMLVAKSCNMSDLKSEGRVRLGRV